MTKKKMQKGVKLTGKELQREILKFFRRNPKKLMNPKQLGHKLVISNNKDSIKYALEKLTEQNFIGATEDYKYYLKTGKGTTKRLRKTDSTLEGKVDMTKTGSAYIVCEGLEDDIYVAAKNMNSALHQDKVKINVWIPRGRRKPEGEVIEVLERAREQFMGTLWLHRKGAVVVPDQSNNPIDIFVDLNDIREAKDGDKVIVKITEWHYRKPKGEVTLVLGKAGGSDLEMKSILINNGFNLAFPDEVIKESEALNEDFSKEIVAARRDFRDVLTFTIDPEDAKDFDDAISIQWLEDGKCEIGVHIADVTHYVQPGTALDKEAFLRSTSVYLVDRVLPMLPEKISNELCSLRPDEDKCTFSAVFVLDNNEKIIERWFGKTLIHSNRRFTYEEAQEVLEKGEGDFASELKFLNRIAKKLKKERFKKGAIDFDTEEVRFRLDEDGVPIEAFIKERKDAHMLVEDFMLLANREVATFIHKKGLGVEVPFVYRIHDEPDPDKVADLARFARQLGFEMNVSTPEQIGKSFNKLTKAAKEDESLNLLAPLAIRTMAKAIYSTENIGHYGLGFSYYTHFTSPIRRYSDVLVHRILYKNLDNQSFRTNKENLEERCKHISKMERQAMDAERESIKYKQVEFMEKHVGEEFEGYISGIIDRGVFVELKGSKCEGMIGFDSMDEPFDVKDGRLSATGIYTGQTFKMGDEVQVKIIATDLARRRIDMELV
ncbi:MAG: ribonuclease R [Bacteroidetes bacterium]|nr:ribonuclease R [Bacteroidota bacterium]